MDLGTIHFGILKGRKINYDEKFIHAKKRGHCS